jgi:excisionase family DNA binding protein
MSDDIERLLTTEEIALALGIHYKTVRKMHKEGRIKGYTLGRNMLRFDLKEVRECIRTENYKKRHHQI